MTDRASDVGRTPESTLADTDRTNPDIVVDNGRVVKDERSDLSPDRAEDATSRDIRRATNETE
jgi:hypothetical protein